MTGLDSQPTLYIMSGLPGSGKSTIARALAAHRQAVFLRIDTIEQALRDLYDTDVEGEGYRLAYRIAAENLRNGMDVVADSCNPIELTRNEWRNVAAEAGARPLDIEVVCSDEQEHRSRVEERRVDVEGLVLPSWQQVLDREYHDWTTPRLVIDTAARDVDGCLAELLDRLAAHGK